MKYVIITPVWNEIQYFRETILSVCSQSLLPVKWVIVDDESNDGTSELIIEHAKKHLFIEHHRLVNYKKNIKSIGGRSGTLMNYARNYIPSDVDYVIKIDADISFGSNFFVKFFEEFDNNPKLGIASGHLIQDGLPEKIVDYEGNRGATRIYRSSCFTELESYYCSRGEDQMDTYKAQYLGWETKTFDIYFDHLKPETSRNGDVSSHYETGCYKGKIPYIFLFFILSTLRSVFMKPMFIGSLYQCIGYINTRYLKKDRPFDESVCDYIRKKQQRKLINIFNLKG